MQVSITNYKTQSVIFSTDVKFSYSRAYSLRYAVIEAIDNEVDLAGAYLKNADLSHLYLDEINLSGANLEAANLYCSNLHGTNLDHADLSYTNLTFTRLDFASLKSAKLYSANLSKSSLRGADLTNAILGEANLCEANLKNANFTDVKGLNFQIPQTGELTVYKRTIEGVVKLRIPPEAKRTATPIGRKCRAEFAEVLEAPAPVCHSMHDQTFVYRVGEIVKADSYDPDWRVECSNGIHFLLTEKEADEYF